MMLLLVLGLTGCGSSNSEESFKEAFKLTFKDPADELKEAFAIDEVLFKQRNWKVYKQEERLAELIQRLITRNGNGYDESVNGKLEISDAFYTFFRMPNPDDDYSQIKAYCSYNKPNVGKVKRIIQINCGPTCTMDYSNNTPYLETGFGRERKWYLSLHYQDANETMIENGTGNPDEERWSGCYYDEAEITSIIKKKKDMNFHSPKIRYASVNYIVFDYNVYLEKYRK